MSDLYQLPIGWEWKNINDVCNKVTDGAHKSPETIEKGRPYITVKDVNKNGLINFNDCKFISEEDYELLVKGNCKPNNGDVLFSKDGTVGKVALVNYDIDFVVLSSLAILKPSENILSEYLKNYLLSPYFYNNAIKSKTGAAIKRVVLKTIKNLDIPLPPLSEQQRIVSKLDKLFEKIDKSIALHQKNIDEADVFMGSVLNDVFEELEEKYEKNLLSNYCQITSSKRVYKADYVDEGVLFYRIKDIVQMAKNIPITDSQYIKRETFEEFDKKFGSPKSGDILLTAVGATLGYTYLVTDGDGDFYFKDGNLLWMKNIKVLDRKFLLHIFKSPLFDRYLDEISKGAAQPAITIVKLKEFNIPIPPLNIQQKVVKYLDEVSEKIEKVKSVQKEKMDRLKALKASILDKAFRGEL